MEGWLALGGALNQVGVSAGWDSSVVPQERRQRWERELVQSMGASQRHLEHCWAPLYPERNPTMESRDGHVSLFLTDVLGKCLM